MGAVAGKVLVGASRVAKRGLVRVTTHEAVASTDPLGSRTQLCQGAQALLRPVLLWWRWGWGDVPGRAAHSVASRRHILADCAFVVHQACVEWSREIANGRVALAVRIYPPAHKMDHTRVQCPSIAPDCNRGHGPEFGTSLCVASRTGCSEVCRTGVRLYYYRY
jgi:hypothetical protein